MRSSADIVICGAGIAGVAAAYHLAVRQKIRRVVIVDEQDPLTLTSDKGTQAYRNWWPGPDDTMLRLVSRSIDLLEETGRERQHLSSQPPRLSVRHGERRPSRAFEATANRVSHSAWVRCARIPDALAYSPAPSEGFETNRSARTSSAETKCTAHFRISRATPLRALHVRRAG